MSMTDKLSREDVRKIAGACGIVLSDSPCVISQAIERFAAAMYAAGAEGMRERADDAWADAIQSDCEHGVKWLSEISATKLQASYPALARLGETIRALPITTTEGERG